MNQRIRELEKQCWSHYVNGVLIDGHLHFDVEKFAELIVKECAKVSEDDITDGDACCTNTAYRIASQIKKHFGVEE
jgi:hypothetical protein